MITTCTKCQKPFETSEEYAKEPDRLCMKCASDIKPTPCNSFLPTASDKKRCHICLFPKSAHSTKALGMFK